MKYAYGKLTEKKLIISNQVDSLYIYDVKDDDIIFLKEMKFEFQEDEYFRNFEFWETENTLIVGKTNGIIQFIDLSSEKILKEVKLPLSNEYYLGWNLDILKLSNDEKWLAIGQTWYTAYPLNLTSFESREISIPAQPLKIEYSFDNKYVAIIHGEQGGQGLVVYLQSEDGNWEEIYEHWAVTGFEFSQDKNIIYHFGLKDGVGVVKAVNLLKGNLTEWETFLSLEELGDTNIHHYGFGLNSLKNVNHCLEFSINKKIIMLDISKGEIIENTETDNLILQTLCNSKIKISLTEEKIILKKI